MLHTLSKIHSKIHKIKTDISHPIRVKLISKAQIPMANYLSFNLLADGVPWFVVLDELNFFSSSLSKNTLKKIHKLKSDISHLIRIRFTSKNKIPIANYLRFNLVADSVPWFLFLDELNFFSSRLSKNWSNFLRN